MGSPTKITIGILISVFVALALGFITKIIRRGYNPPTYIIGLVYVPSLPFHEYVNERLKAKIKADGRFTVKEFTPASTTDLTSVNNICAEALESNANLLIGTGIRCTKALVQNSEKRKIKKPILFLAVLDPVKYELIQSTEKPGANVTGIESDFSPADLPLLINLLKTIKPCATSVLLPYANIPDGHDSHAPELQKLGLTRGINVTLLPIHIINETLPLTTGLITSHDTLMYLEGDGVALCGPGLGKLASQHNATMFAGSIDGVIDAAISYMPDPICFVDGPFDMAKEILINKQNPATMPVRQASITRSLVLNTPLWPEQGLGDLNVQEVVRKIRSNPQLAAIHDHIIVDGVKVS